MEAMGLAEPGDDRERALSAIASALAVEGRAGARVVRLELLSGGASKQNWAFLLEEEGGKEAGVLRMAPPEARFGAEGTIGLATEAALLRLAGEAGVPVPKVLFEVKGTPGVEGYAMERVEGESVGSRILRDERLREARSQLARQCGRLLARIHAVPRNRLPELETLDPVRAVASLEQRHRATGQARPVFELAFRWLQERLPEGGRPGLVHGDFRNGNLIVGPDGVRAVLDWETSHLGSPGEDLGWLCVTSWRFGRPDLPVGGFGTLEELLAGYREAGGTPIGPEELLFWETYGTLRWGIMCAEVGARFEEGVRSTEGGMIARRASETEHDLLALIFGSEADAG